VPDHSSINDQMGTREQRLAVLHHLSLGLAHDFRTPLTLIRATAVPPTYG